MLWNRELIISIFDEYFSELEKYDAEKMRHHHSPQFTRCFGDNTKCFIPNLCISHHKFGTNFYGKYSKLLSKKFYLVTFYH